MENKLIDGKAISEKLRQNMASQVERLVAQGITPGLAFVLVGDNPASATYIRMKGRACKKIGIVSNDRKLPEEVKEEELISVIEELNADKNIHGILVQLPLPNHLDEEKILNKISPEKDVDGFHPVNVGKMVLGRESFLPCTPAGVIELLKETNIPIQGSHVVIVGRSNIVGKPLANMLIQKRELGNATVTICHSRTKDLTKHTTSADILVAAIGKAEFIKKDMIKEGAVIIDVGINRVDDPGTKKGYRIVGDVDFASCKDKVSAISPVPGGVGPMTITMLLANTIRAALQTQDSF